MSTIIVMSSVRMRNSGIEWVRPLRYVNGRILVNWSSERYGAGFGMGRISRVKPFALYTLKRRCRMMIAVSRWDKVRWGCRQGHVVEW